MLDLESWSILFPLKYPTSLVRQLNYLQGLLENSELCRTDNLIKQSQNKNS